MAEAALARPPDSEETPKKDPAVEGSPQDSPGGSDDEERLVIDETSTKQPSEESEESEYVEAQDDRSSEDLFQEAGKS